MKPESMKRLKDFVERAEMIQTYSYFNNPENIVGYEVQKVGDKWHVDFHQPDREQTDSLLFNLRLFVQNKDDISIGRLGELCFDEGISKKWKMEYELIRNRLNERLDELVVSEGPKGILSFREVFNMFLFGALGHRTEKDKAYKLFQKWVTDETEWAILYNTFHEIVIWVSTAIINIGKISKEELSRK